MPTPKTEQKITPNSGPNLVEPRVETDTKLEEERQTTDQSIQNRESKIEESAEAIIQTSRNQADAVVKLFRENAKQKAASSDNCAPEVAAALLKHEIQEDKLLDRERMAADAIFEAERQARRKYLMDLFASERESTNQAIDQEREQADAEIAVRDTFLGAVSHDMRNLLAGLSMRTDLMSKLVPRDDLGIQLNEHISTTRRFIAQMNRLVNDLLDLVSISAGQLRIMRHPVDIVESIRQTLESYQPLATARGIQMQTVLPNEHKLITVDEGRILQVIANLLFNSLKFTKADGTVGITVKLDEHALSVAVQDTGVGIPADQREAIFDAFRQVRPDKRGLGLGLHISRAIVEAHGGRIWAESTVGKGSTFSFEIYL